MYSPPYWSTCTLYNPGKAKAAKYLGDKGITVISFTDKYYPLLLGVNSSIFVLKSLYRPKRPFYVLNTKTVGKVHLF